MKEAVLTVLPFPARWPYLTTHSASGQLLSTKMETWHLCKYKLILRRGHERVDREHNGRNFCFQLDHYGGKVSFQWCTAR
jgi:hypothetical protein